MGNSVTVHEFKRFLVRKLRKYKVLSEDIPGEDGVALDSTPIDLGDGGGAVDSLTEIDGLPAHRVSSAPSARGNGAGRRSSDSWVAHFTTPHSVRTCLGTHGRCTD